ncbi:unnamed protein product [Penicillium olsonii]|uniref:Zn(2)-C6 fungal-type domain-containing protein n=1 Tax=Penicillium olsonii TaxID=99116 RepID=A0A9W4MX57_PENOL|nr:unnamed protein product [Penicillium olsonii]CAG8139499.1 unnamed protein product [Penicillium olsonii]
MDCGDTPSQAPPNTKVISPRRLRRRARKACVYCHNRKVRCNVSIRGSPCVNCRLDGETCIIPGRSKNIKRVRQQSIDHAGPSQLSKSPIPGPIPSQYHGADEPDWTSRDRPSSAQETLAPCPADPHPSTNNESFDWIKNVLRPHHPGRSVHSTRSQSVGNTSHSDEKDRARLLDSGPSADVSYSYYPFLSIKEVRNLSPQDFNCLESQGCLKVPVPDYLDDFVHQYFLHVHPMLPLINEGNFWDLYSNREDNPHGTISLLVLQAMLFASCNFISLSTVHALGYPSIRVMRASYYRHAKLLYDFGSESSHVLVAQAALLLSFTSLSERNTPYVSWLSIAIENAKMAEAHLYGTLPTSSITPQERNILKRLWWCCIIRDRSTGLLMRRPIQITSHHFDFAVQPLCFEDLADEIERSMVYDSSTKEKLAVILTQWSELNASLTDILMLVFPLDERQVVSPQQKLANSTQISDHQAVLAQWFDSVISQLSFPFPGVKTPMSCRRQLKRGIHPSSVILYTNLMMMYYHTSRIAITHFKLSQLNKSQTSPKSDRRLHQSPLCIFETRQELRDATRCIAECHTQLVNRGLDRWLPLSAIGCTALPLVLHLLDTKLYSRLEHEAAEIESTTGSNQRQLDDLVSVMKSYQLQYDNSDWMTKIVRHIINIAQIDIGIPNMQTSAIDWTDILVFQPTSYLRMTLALDISLRKGRLAEEGDFPSRLRNLSFIELQPSMDAADTNNSKGMHVESPGPSPLDSAYSVANRRESRDQELSSLSSPSEHGLEFLEDQIYLHLAGGMTQ